MYNNYNMYKLLQINFYGKKKLMIAEGFFSPKS